MYLVDPMEDESDVWADARIKQLCQLKLQICTLQDVYNAIAARVPVDRKIRAIYGSLSRPPGSILMGGLDQDIECLTSDADLQAFLNVVHDTYKPICL